MEPDSEEPVLPYTPSNSGRRARVGYLGFDGVGFNGLWPLFAGLVLSIALALKFFVAERAGAQRTLRQPFDRLRVTKLGVTRWRIEYFPSAS